MKKCPKCQREYDDTWGICINCSIPLEDKGFHLETSPLSSIKAGMNFEQDPKKLFLPKKGFYDNWNASQERMLQMMKDIFVWLEMDTSNLWGGYSVDLAYPGVYMKREWEDIILINSGYRNNPFETGAILAHECIHHYMRKQGLEIPERLENERKTDLLTISTGLGVLYVNGMSYESNWYITAIALLAGFFFTAQEKKWFGYFPPKEYCKHFLSYLKSKNLTESDVMGFIHPKSKHFLPIDIQYKKAKKKSDYVSILESQHSQHLTIQIVVVAFIALLFGGIYLASHYGSTDYSETSTSDLDETRQKLEYMGEKIEESVERLEAIENEMAHYERMGDIRNYNTLVATYNDLQKKIQKEYRNYEFGRRNYNKRIGEINQ